MKSPKKLTHNNYHGYGQKLVAKLLITAMLVLDVPFLQLVQSAKADIVTPGNWVTIPVKADPMLQGLSIPANASTQGMWSGVQSWPLNGLHATVLPDSRVLTYGTNLDGANQNGRYFDIWDSTVGFGASSHQTTYRAQQQDSFCSTAAFLNNGSLLISGGNGGTTSTLFNPSTNAVTQPTSNMALQRWYSTMLNLPDGRLVILGGMVPYNEPMEDNPDQAIAQGLASMTPEILETTGWRSLTGAYSREAFGPDFLRTSMPRAWIAPNGLVFGVSSDKMWYLDPAGNGSFPYMGNYKQYSATTPVNAGTTNTAVMYAPGKILMVGGNGGYVGDGKPASNKVTVIDINAGTPVLTEQPSMVNARRFANSIILANGQVVVSGGTKLANNNGTDAVYATEVWTPSTANSSSGTWATGASAAIFRGYHGQTLLMPNGSYFVYRGRHPWPCHQLKCRNLLPSLFV